VASIPIDVVLERLQNKEIIRGLLHTILFHRLFGSIKPQMIDVQGVSFPCVSDPDIESLVNEKVDAFMRALDGIPGGNGVIKKGQIVVVLSEKRQKRQWFSTAEEQVPWEQWVLTLQILPSYSIYPTRPMQENLPPSSSLNDVLLRILTHVSSITGRDAVPPIVIGGVISPFPLKIEIRVGDQMIGTG